MKRDLNLYRVSGLLSVFMFSIGPALLALSTMGVYAQLFVSRLASVSFLFLFAVLYRPQEHLSQLKSLNTKKTVYLFCSGLHRVLIGATFYYSISYGPKVENLLISQLWPMMYYLLDKNSTKSKSNNFCVSMGLIGSVVVLLGEKSLDSIVSFHYTYIISLLHSFLLAIYFITFKKAKKSQSKLTSCSFSILFQESIGFFVILIFFPYFEIDFTITSNDLALMIFYGIFAHSLPRLLTDYASLGMSATDFSLQRFITPILATCFMLFFFDGGSFKHLLIGSLVAALAVLIKYKEMPTLDVKFHK